MSSTLPNFIEKHKLPAAFKTTTERYYQPLADIIYGDYCKSLNNSENGSTFFVGVNGSQGSGKSTLTDFISEYLTSQYQLNVAVLSLDDFYFSTEKRQQLAKSIHPLLATRGVPGTHDIAALDFVLGQLKQRKTDFLIPKFNKATDEPYSVNEWTLIDKAIDIVLVEGWCWGVKPQSIDQLRTPINELEKQKDTNGVWRNYVNQQLLSNYKPLYEVMNFWLALKAPSFENVYQWRLEQEQKLRVKNAHLIHSKIMNSEEVSNFIQYFERLSVQELDTIKNATQATFFLGTNRQIVKMTIMDKHE